MAIYSVYLPPDNREDAPDRIVFLNDGKAVLALVAPIVWLLWHRLWLETGIYVLLMVTFAALVQFGQPEIVSFLSLLPGIYLLIEGHEMLRKRYERQGWQFDGVVEAGDKESAELRYFSNHYELHHIIKPTMITNQVRRPAPIGLFPE